MRTSTPTAQALTGQAPAPAEPVAPQAGRGKTIAALFAGALILAVVLGFGAAAVIGRPDSEAKVIVPPPPPQPQPQPQPEPKPEAPKAPEKLSVTFETKPAGAEVFEDDVLVGTSPVTLMRARDQVISLRFELKGHKPLVRKVRFEEGERKVLVELEKKGGGGAGPAPKKDKLHDNPYESVKDLKDLPD
jgi:hypothetical protein